MKYLLGLVVIASSCLGATSPTTKVVDCRAIFEEKKQELDLKLDAIRKEQSNLDALKGATLSLQGQREKKIELKAKEVLGNLKLITQKELAMQQAAKQQQDQMKKMIDENKKILEEIKTAKDDKVLAVYMKMKPGSSAAIFSEMNATTASNLIARMDPKKAAEVLAKMDAKKASAITEAMKK
jgi:flagellar motility protein MotE (MotC chaperone)